MNSVDVVQRIADTYTPRLSAHFPVIYNGEISNNRYHCKNSYISITIQHRFLSETFESAAQRTVISTPPPFLGHGFTSLSLDWVFSQV